MQHIAEKASKKGSNVADQTFLNFVYTLVRILMLPVSVSV
jgi:hypothetical protein